MLRVIHFMLYHSIYLCKSPLF